MARNQGSSESLQGKEVLIIREHSRQTVLHPCHVSLGARMVDFAGWRMPIQYRGILEEHAACREGAAAFDISHMGEIEVRAADVRASLGRVLSNDLSEAPDGAARYGFILNDQGGIIDELLDHIEIECKVTEIPETIVVSVNDLEVGQSLNAGEISLPAGMKLVTDPKALILHCHLVAAAKSTEEFEEELPSEPEVITEKADEADESEPEKKSN